MEIVFDLSIAEVLQLVVAVFLPLLVGLVTTRVTSSGTKAVLLLFLSALTAFLTSALDAANAGAAWDVKAALLAFVMTFVTGVAMHFGLWNPTNLAGAAQDTRALTVFNRSSLDKTE